MDQLSYTDIFKKSFVAMSSGMEHFSTIEIISNLSISFLIGLFIFYVYKKTFQGVLYQHSFNVSLVSITMVITLIIMTISGNLILSLGMVGALSIVRFRTPIKDPVDLVFIFWAISVGIANGVGYYNISIIGSILLTLVLLLMTQARQTNDLPYLLIIQAENKDIDDRQLVSSIKPSVSKIQLKSKAKTETYTEVILEIRLKKADTSFINQLYSDFGAQKITLISYSGELAQA